MLGAARRQVREHAVLCLGAAGLVVGAVAVLAGGRAVAARADLPLTSWLGIEDTRNEPVGPLPGTLWLAAVVLLAVLWVVLLEVARRRGLAPGRVWALAGVWALPFVAGPPIMDTVVYSDVAYGRLLRNGLDPYAVGPSRLGETALVLAIDPGDRGQATSAGPLGTFLAHLALSISGGSDLLAVLVLRGMALVAVLWIGRSAIELAGRASGGPGAGRVRREPARPALRAELPPPRRRHGRVPARRAGARAAAPMAGGGGARRRRRVDHPGRPGRGAARDRRALGVPARPPPRVRPGPGRRGRRGRHRRRRVPAGPRLRLGRHRPRAVPPAHAVLGRRRDRAGAVVHRAGRVLRRPGRRCPAHGRARRAVHGRSTCWSRPTGARSAPASATRCSRSACSPRCSTPGTCCGVCCACCRPRRRCSGCGRPA